MQEGSGVTNLQTEMNYLDSFKSYCNSSDLDFLGSGGGPGGSAIVFMSSGMFRGKESSNRIELSQLVQELLILVFWAPCGSGEGVGGLGGIWVHGGCPHTYAHACTCTHMRTHTFIHA